MRKTILSKVRSIYRHITKVLYSYIKVRGSYFKVRKDILTNMADETANAAGNFEFETVIVRKSSIFGSGMERFDGGNAANFYEFIFSLIGTDSYKLEPFFVPVLFLFFAFSIEFLGQLLAQITQLTFDKLF